MRPDKNLNKTNTILVVCNYNEKLDTLIEVLIRFFNIYKNKK